MILIGYRVDAQHAAPPAAGGAANAESPGGTTGKVVETMSAGGYTYVEVDDGTKKIWAAAPQFAVAVGDKVAVPDGMEMRDFYSKTLERTFDLVYFVPAIQVVSGRPVEEQVAAAHGAAGHGAAGQSTAAHGAGMTAAAPALDLSNIHKAAGGYTVAELFAKKADLAGKEVAVRGRVAKFTPQVMGKNWMHMRDGTGDAGTNDVTVATTATAAVGNMVLVRGKLTTDKDLGFGYRYDIIIEDATVAVE
jgi:hypothetical protein